MRDFFNSSSKWVKQQRQLTTATTHLAQELLTNVQCSGGSRSFVERDKSLEDEEHSGQPSEVDNDHYHGSSKLMFLQLTTWEVAKKLSVSNSVVVQHLKQNGKVKKLDKVVPYVLTTSQKNYCFEVIFSYSMQQQQIISWMDCDMHWKVDFIQQLAVTSWVAGPRGSSKALPKAKVAPKKVMVTVWRSAPIWSTTAFWIPVKPLHLRSMLSKLMRYTENCKAWSWHWSTEWTQSFSMTMPNCTSHQHFKSWMYWAMKFCLICTIVTWLLTNLLLLLQVFIICQAFCCMLYMHYLTLHINLWSPLYY